MARYCFYCSRELAAGERCQCKNPQAAGEKASARSSKNKNASGPSGTDPRFWGKAGAARSTGNNTYARTGSKPFGKAVRSHKKWFSHFLTFKDQVRTMFPTFSHAFSSGSQYFMRPGSKIRQESLRSKRSLSFIYILGFSMLTGLLGVMLSQSGSALYIKMLSVVMGPDLSLVYSFPGYTFAAMAVLTFLLSMMICGSFYIAARLSNRKPTFRKTVDLVSLSLVYPFVMEVFLLITILLGGRGSLSLLLIGILLMGITNFISFRNALGMSEDAVFFFLMFVYFICYIFISILLFAAVRLLVLV